MPVDLLQMLFTALDPLLALRKFSRFAALAPGGAEARDFVAVEDWLNDGVPLALPVARECLGGWYGADTPATRPLAHRRAAGAAATRRAARASSSCRGRTASCRRQAPRRLAMALPAAERLMPPLGHIGMIVAREARRRSGALAQWLRAKAPLAAAEWRAP